VCCSFGELWVGKWRGQQVAANASAVVALAAVIVVHFCFNVLFGCLFNIIIVCFYCYCIAIIAISSRVTGCPQED